MKILAAPAHYIIADDYGSEPYWSYKIVDTLGRKGIDVTAIVGWADLKNALYEKVKVRKILKKGRSKNAFIEIFHKGKFPYDFYKIAENILKNEEIDIIHHIEPMSDVAYNLLPILKKLKKPFIMGPAMPPQQVSSDDDFARWLNVNYGFASNIVKFGLKFVDKPLHILFKKTIIKADKVICVTKNAKKHYSQYIDEEKIEVVPIGIEIERFTPNTNIPENNKEINLLSVGYLLYRKGFHILLKAMKEVLKEYPNTKLKIVGDGMQLEELQRLTKKLDLGKNVEFCGFVPFTEIEKYYQECDIFCNPTLSEPFGQVNIEAMACGKTIVGSRVGALPEIITKDVGILVEPNNAEQLSHAIINLIEDNEKREMMGKNARNRVEKYYSWDSVIDQYIKIYRELLNEI